MLDEDEWWPDKECNRIDSHKWKLLVRTKYFLEIYQCLKCKKTEWKNVPYYD